MTPPPPLLISEIRSTWSLSENIVNQGDKKYGPLQIKRLRLFLNKCDRKIKVLWLRATPIKFYKHYITATTIRHHHQTRRDSVKKNIFCCDEQREGQETERRKTEGHKNIRYKIWYKRGGSRGRGRGRQAERGKIGQVNSQNGKSL